MKTIRGRFRAAVLMGAAASLLTFAAEANAQNTWPYLIITGPPPPPPPVITPSPVLAVVGDIACQPGVEVTGEASNETCADPASPYTATSLWQSQVATANQIENMKPD